MYRAERNKLFVAVFLLTCHLPARGQVGSAVLLGVARDASAALAPGVKVVAIQDGTSFSRTTTTGPDGSYRLEHLLPGRYTVKAEKNGFQPLTVHPVDLEVQQKGTLDLALTIGATRDSVAVSAIVSPIQAHDASVSYRLDAPEILELPLAVRNVISLVTLGPDAIPRQLGGFTHDVINDVQAARGAVALNPPINGGRPTMNSFLLDGAADTDRNTFAIAVTPPMESVQEFRIASSLGPPDSPQSGGGVMDIITKAGSANYHGSTFEYFQNESTHARNYFDDPTLPCAIFRQQQFGGSLGGPVPALSSTFFFGAYEGLIGKSAKSTQSFVPDPAARAGDFTGRKLIFDPLSARNPFPNNLLPANRIDPIASQFLSLYEPLPNRAGAGGNYVDATPNRNTNHSVSGRIDHQFHNQTQLFGRYTLNNEDGEIAGNFPVRPVTENVRAQQFALGSMFAPLSWLNEARFAFTRLRVFDVPHSAFASNVARQLGVTGLPDDPFTYGLPQFEIVNFSTVTDDPTLPQLQRDNQWSLSDGVTLLRGRHTLKGGIQFTRAGTNYLQSNRVRGEYVYTGAFTGNLTSPGTTGDALADFLLGYPQRTIRTVGSAMAYLRQNVYGAYLQDEWKVNSRLTVNVGARYEYFSPLTDARGNLHNLEYSKLPAPPRLVNVQRSTNPDRNNFAPRAGLAWRIPNVVGVKQDTVFRAGYGIYYSQEIATGTYDLIRNQVRNETNQTDGVTPILTTRDGFRTPPRLASPETKRRVEESRREIDAQYRTIADTAPTLDSGQSFEWESRLRRFDGEFRWFLFRGSPFRDQSGKLVKWYGTNTDIEDRKRAEEALRASEHNLRLIVNSIPAQVWMGTPAGELELVNQPVLDYTGRTLDELKDAFTFVHRDDLQIVCTLWNHSVETGDTFDVEVRLLRADGVHRWLHARGLPLRDAEGRIVRWYILLTDIEDRKNAEEALHRTQAQLSRASQIASVGELAASIAHEVNQPISAVVANGHACLRWLLAEPPNLAKAREAAERIVRDGTVRTPERWCGASGRYSNGLPSRKSRST
jgi:PAS domain S-box-containing protein